jgi:hypothetical protein
VEPTAANSSISGVLSLTAGNGGFIMVVGIEVMINLSEIKAFDSNQSSVLALEHDNVAWHYYVTAASSDLFEAY